MTNAEQNSTDRLIRVLQEQQSLVEQLAKLATQQSELVESGKTEALLSVLGRRQELIDRVIASQSDLTTLLEELRCDRSNVSEASKRQIGGLVETINHQLAQVMKRDSEDQERLESRRDRTRQELVGVDTAKKAHQAYFKPHPVMNRVADR
ncbi:MAG: hypothetical protein IIA64_01410, partial [Planctomycetes bacterium]|nr:hypothetical protein [Planctomycetota bacterium]